MAELSSLHVIILCVCIMSANPDSSSNQVLPTPTVLPTTSSASSLSTSSISPVAEKISATTGSSQGFTAALSTNYTSTVTSSNSSVTISAENTETISRTVLSTTEPSVMPSPTVSMETGRISALATIDLNTNTSESSINQTFTDTLNSQVAEASFSSEMMKTTPYISTTSAGDSSYSDLHEMTPSLPQTSEVSPSISETISSSAMSNNSFPTTQTSFLTPEASDLSTSEVDMSRTESLVVDSSQGQYHTSPAMAGSTYVTSTQSVMTQSSIQTTPSSTKFSTTQQTPTKTTKPGASADKVNANSSGEMGLGAKVAIGVTVSLCIVALVILGVILYRRYNFTHRSLKSFLTSGVRYKTYNNATYKDDEGMLIMPDRH